MHQTFRQTLRVPYPYVQVTPSSSFRGAQTIFRVKPFHVQYRTFSIAVTLRTDWSMKMKQSVPKRWHLTFSLLVTGCTSKLNILTIVRSARTVLMCFVFIWEQTATCAIYIKKWLVFITEMKSVYSAVRTGYSNKAVCTPSFKVQTTDAGENPRSKHKIFKTRRKF
jgi:hypothetical protein